jgi:signal transduction histidine kinase
MGTSIPKDAPRRKWFQWYHLYFFLAAFDVLTISASLYLNHTVLAIYSDSVQQNSVWSNRVSHYSRLNDLAAAVNAPGNDVFESGNFSREQRRLTQASLAFRKATTTARVDLQRNQRQESWSGLLRKLDQIDSQVALIQKESMAIFSELKRDNRKAAGSRMAEMDRCFSRSLGLIGTLCEQVRQIQTNRFNIHTARAQRLGRFELALYGVVCLILGVVTWYGHKLAKYMRQSETDVANAREIAESASRAKSEIQQRAAEQIMGLARFPDENGSPVLRSGAAGKLTYANVASSPLLDQWRTQVGETLPADVRATVQKTLNTRKTIVIEVTADNQWYALSVTPVPHENYVNLYAANITSRKQVEADLVQAKQDAEAANQANMSHEIRTPMTAILGFNNILLENVSSPENIDAARTVKENGEFLIDLINDILDLSKIEAGKIEVEQISRSPHEIVAEVSSLMKVRAKAKGLPLDVHFEGPIPETIHTDPTRLRQVLINVVGNAIKFTETGSPMSMRARSS